MKMIESSWAVGVVLLLFLNTAELTTPLPPASFLRLYQQDVNKCCEKGFQLHATEQKCVPRPGVEPENVKWEVLRLPLEAADAYWLPESMRSRPRVVNYDALDTASHKDKIPPIRQSKLSYSTRVEAKDKIVKGFLNINSTARIFELGAFRGRVISTAVRRQKFCFDAVDNSGIVVFTTLELRHVTKCCPKGYHLDAKAEKCEVESEVKVEDVSEEIIDPYENPKHASWLPRKLLRSVIAAAYRREPLIRWNVVVSSNAFVDTQIKDEADDDDEDDDDAEKLSKQPTHEDDSNDPSPLWRLREDGAGYTIWVRGDSRTGGKVSGPATDFCFDTTADGTFLPHRVVLARLWTLPKCCGSGEQLDANAAHCEARPGVDGSDEEFQNLSDVVAKDSHYWVPRRLVGQKGVMVEYLRDSDRKWISKRREISADDETRWQLVSKEGEVPKVMISSISPSNEMISSRAWVYCFDAVSSGKRVLLTVFSQVNKCCRKDEQLDVRAAKCVPRPGIEGDDSEVGVVNPQKDPDSAFWIPDRLRTDVIPVRYDYGLLEKGGVVFEASHSGRWELDFHGGGDTLLSVSSTTLTGSSKKVYTGKFCFDAIDKGPVALIADVCFLQDFNCFFKCCPSGKSLYSNGTCTESKGRDWSPRISNASEFLSSEGLYTAKILSHPICGNTSFYIEAAPNSPQAFAERLQSKAFTFRFSKTFLCADYVVGEDAGGGGRRESLAYCVAPPIAPAYEAVRPLSVAAVALLAAALALLLRAEDTRASTHGRALACHAACLLAANATQAAWFFFDRDDAYCKFYAYIIYFFLVAAGTWLNAISINLARGFKRPLGAMGGRKRREGGAASELRRFAVLSAWAWGAALALTALCVLAHERATQLEAVGVPAPSLFETRTCFFEVVYTESLRQGKVNKKDDLGAVYYFYAPMGVLVVANAVCLGLTMWSIRALKRDASHVQRMGQSTGQSFQSAVLYVKLLLSAGVVELAVEGVAWGARSRRFYGSSEWAEEFAAQSAFVFAIVGTCLDVARAAAVLWLCVGRCRWPAAPADSRLCACCAWIREGVRGLSLRRVSQPATFLTDVGLEDTNSSSATNESNASAKTSTLSLASAL